MIEKDSTQLNPTIENNLRTIAKYAGAMLFCYTIPNPIILDLWKKKMAPFPTRSQSADIHSPQVENSTDLRVSSGGHQQ